MTPLQRRAFDFIDGFITSQGMSPSYGEIAQALGQATRANAFSVVSHLVAQGYLERQGRGKRNIRVLKHLDTPAMPMDGPGLPRLARSLERWAGMVPTAVADGSRAQVVYALADAKADIAALAGALLTREGTP